MRILPSAGLLLALSLSSELAHADVAKAWTVARDGLPSTSTAIAGIDIATLVKSPVFPPLFAAIKREERDIGMAYELVKSTCKLDPINVVEGLIFAGDPEKESGVILLQLSIDRAKTSACLEQVLKTVEPKAVVKQDGIFTTIGQGSDTVYIAWPAANVMAFSLTPDKKADIQTWLGGKAAFAKTALSAQLAKVDTKAVAWGAVAFAKPMPDPEMPIVSATGTVVAGKGSFTVAVKGTFANAAAAGKVLADFVKELKETRDSKKTPAAVKKLLGAVKAATSGTDVTLDGTATEADLQAAVSALP